MSAIVNIVSYAFYTLTLLALLFFIHKVLWLVQYKRLQTGLVERAIQHLRSGNADVLKEWDEFAKARWSEALEQPDVGSPSSFIRRVEEWLSRLRSDMRTTKKSLESLLSNALAQGEPGITETVLSLRRLSKGMPERNDVNLDILFPKVASPKGPDKKLFELRVKSRYGWLRRALVFFSGAADVVYSSQHVALMSQNVHVPTSVLVRRLSLVFLVIFVVLIDMIFGARRYLAEVYEDWLYPSVHQGFHAFKTASERGFFDENLPAMLAFGTWMAVYGSIYIALYLMVRRRYQINVKRLREMLASEETILASIRERHVRELVSWGREYGRSLDSSIAITMRHAETLLDNCADRLRRRIAGDTLLDGARVIGDALLAKLPESEGELQDQATTRAHSFAHYVWPRLEEMEYQVRIAQYRAAWQHVELAVNELRGRQPDPQRAHSLWRAAVTYATIFSDIMPAKQADILREAYGHMVEECVEATDKDLEELDRRLGELSQRLNEQLESAKSLVASKVELANQQILAAAQAFSAEIIHVREQARLEAMAFEI